ncbi:MAG: hypothetical protein ACON38_06795 [Akkermansiaceae bacterium]
MKQRTDKQILQDIVSRAFDEVFGEYPKELDEATASLEPLEDLGMIRKDGASLS